MKKIILSIILLCLLSTSITSVNAINCRHLVNKYDSTFFDELYYSIAWATEKEEGGGLYGMTIDSNMNSIVVGMTDQNEFNARPIIVKYDEDGNELWSDVPIASNLASVQVQELKSFLPSQLELAVYNSQLSARQVKCIQPIQSTTYSEIAFRQLQQIQGVVFRSSYVPSGEYSAAFTDVAIDPNNDYIVAAGIIYNHNTLKQDIYIVKYTPNGNVLWDTQFSFKTIDTNVQVVIASDSTIYLSSFSTWIDGGLLISPVIKIAKLSPLGQVKQTTTYEVDSTHIPKPVPYLIDAAVHPTTGNIWIVAYLPYGGGYEDGDMDNDFCLVEYTPNLEKITEWQYDSGTSPDPECVGICDFPRGMVIDDDGNIIVAGMRAVQIDTSGNMRSLVGHIVKFSPSGDVLLDIEDYEIKEFYDVSIRNSISVPRQEIVATAANFSDPNLGDNFVIFLYDGVNGAKLLDVVEGSDETESAYAVAVNPEGNLIVAGLRSDCIENGTFLYNFLTRYFIITENSQSSSIEDSRSISCSQPSKHTSTTSSNLISRIVSRAISSPLSQ